MSGELKPCQGIDGHRISIDVAHIAVDLAGAAAVEQGADAATEAG